MASQPQHKLKRKSFQRRHSHLQVMKPTKESFNTTIEPWEEVNTL